MWKLVTGAAIVGSTLFLTKKYFAGKTCKCTARLDGLTVIITGANSGLGRALAIQLYKKGATLILACRNVDDVQLGKLVSELSKQSNPKGQIFLKTLDLNDFESIVKFCAQIKCEFPEIYALVNNAGVFYCPQELTKDGFDTTLQTNYLGPFILTHYLLSCLKRSEHARIINIVSTAHRLVNSYDLKAVTRSQGEFRPHFTAYGVSKLALTLFTRELSKVLSTTNIIVNAVDPGNVETSIYRHYPPLANRFLFALQWPIRAIVVKRPVEGIQTILHALLTPNRSTGQYLYDCKPIPLSAAVLNDQLSHEYYHLTFELLAQQFGTESEC